MKNLGFLFSFFLHFYNIIGEKRQTQGAVTERFMRSQLPVCGGYPPMFLLLFYFFIFVELVAGIHVIYDTV